METTELTESEVEQAHAIADLSRSLGQQRRANNDARELLVLAAHALSNGNLTVVGEFIDRAELRLRRAES